MTSKMRALKIQEKGKAAITETPKPSLRPDYILVKVKAVALNPTDWKHIGFVSAKVTVGCDYAGIVEDVGSSVKLPWKKGDRVCGVLHGANEMQLEDGAFGDYAVAKGDLQIRIPEALSFEAAATLGMGVSTVGQGMYQALELPLPNQPAKEKFPVLIYGGSAAMGSYGIQYAKQSGLEVITTCSPKNNDYVKSLGADAVFDYNSPSCGADIRKATDNKLYYAWDAIGESNSAQIIADALSSDSKSHKLRYANVLGAKMPRDDVDSKRTLMYTTMGEDISKGGKPIPASKEDFEFMKKFVAISQDLIDTGKIKPVNFEVRDGGLDGILGGLDDMKNNKVSGKKLVYKL